MKLSDPQCLSVQSAPRGGRKAPRGERHGGVRGGRRKRDGGDGGKKVKKSLQRKQEKKLTQKGTKGLLS